MTKYGHSMPGKFLNDGDVMAMMPHALA